MRLRILQHTTGTYQNDPQPTVYVSEFLSFGALGMPGGMLQGYVAVLLECAVFVCRLYPPKLDELIPKLIGLGKCISGFKDGVILGISYYLFVKFSPGVSSRSTPRCKTIPVISLIAVIS